MLQLATLRHDSVTFYRRDPPMNAAGVPSAGRQVQVRRLEASVTRSDLFNETVWRELFRRSTDRSSAPLRLAPDRCYAYHDGGVLHGAFCTPPAPSAASSDLRGLFGSCMAVTVPPFHRLRAFEWAWEQLQPHVALLLGDLVYTDIEQTWLSTWRVPGNLVWRRTWQVPALERLLRIVPALLMHDDHEIRNGWDGTVGGNEEALADLDAWTRGRRPRHWRWGQDVSFFVVDTRSYRTTGSLLGEEQWRDLRDWLRNDNATWHVLASPSLFARSLGKSPVMDDGDGGWGDFPTDQERLLELAPCNTVVLSGDVHWALAVEHLRSRGDKSGGRGGHCPVWEFGASPFQAIPFPAPQLDMAGRHDANERVHFLRGSAFFHGSFSFNGPDKSLGFALHSTSVLTDATSTLYSKTLTPVTVVYS